MPENSGLAGGSLRLNGEEIHEPAAGGDEDIVVEDADGQDQRQLDEHGNVIQITHDDGSITISLDGTPVEKAEDDAPPGWFDNLVHKIPDVELSRISEDLLRGIASDEQSRSEWIETRAQGIALLGLKVEMPGTQGSADGAPVEGMSKVRHPLLLEAVLRFQANARAEMLPTDGPVKLRNDNNDPTLQEDELADALEKDMNHYLTEVATEYYPDSDRMYLMVGFGGIGFKKVYNCPLRNRPTSESVDADDLIVSMDATDTQNAKRVTHRILMKPSTVKRMQILKVYRDIQLPDPKQAEPNAAARAEHNQQGTDPTAALPEDRDREIYECYCELNIPGFEHKLRGKATGLEVPYRVTIDVSSREILSIVRDYDEPAKNMLPERRETFVVYLFVPGLGFYGIGLLHILGNTTNAITAAWRELLDAGMYSNFPGVLMSDMGGRQNSNILRVPPGGAAMIKTGGMKIGDFVTPLPYKEPSMALMQLVQNMAETGQRVGGTSETQVAEGRGDVPVGTMLAMVEVAQKILNSVHKRMHTAQAKEFQLLMQRFRENPEAFWQRKNRSGYKWDEQKFLQALSDYEIVPQADPNTASHSQRVMKVVALKTMQKEAPALYDPIAVERAALRAVGWGNPDQFLLPPQAQAQKPPELVQAEAKAAADGKRADAAMLSAQASMIKAQKPDAPQGLGAAEPPDPAKLMDAQTNRMEAETSRMGLQFKAQEVGLKHKDSEVEDENRDLDRQAATQNHVLEIAREVIAHGHEGQRQEADHGHEHEIVDKEIASRERVAKHAAKQRAKAAAKKPAAKK
jgi:hypothetical protein